MPTQTWDWSLKLPIRMAQVVAATASRMYCMSFKPSNSPVYYLPSTMRHHVDYLEFKRGAITLFAKITPSTFPTSFHLARHVHQVLHQDVGGILGTAASGLQHAEAGMHEHHQGAAKAHPRRVQGTSQAVVSCLECRHLTSKGWWFGRGRSGSRKNKRDQVEISSKRDKLPSSSISVSCKSFIMFVKLWIPCQAPTQLVDRHGWRLTLMGKHRDGDPRLLLLGGRRKNSRLEGWHMPPRNVTSE